MCFAINAAAAALVDSIFPKAATIVRSIWPRTHIALCCSYTHSRVESTSTRYSAFLSCTGFCGGRVIYDQERGGGWAQSRLNHRRHRHRRRRRRCRLCNSKGATSFHCTPPYCRTALHCTARFRVENAELCFYCSRIRERI